MHLNVSSLLLLKGLQLIAEKAFHVSLLSFEIISQNNQLLKNPKWIILCKIECIELNNTAKHFKKYISG